MTRIQKSIEINAPVHAAYSQLMQFDAYPRFMEDIDSVQQTDETHLHCSARMAEQHMEWDAEITEQLEDSRIAWRNVNGAQNVGKVELEPLGEKKALVTLTLECELNQQAAQPGNAEAAVGKRVEQGLTRFKKLIEGREAEIAVAGGQGIGLQADATTQSDFSLSRSSGQEAEPDQFSVAEEQNFDAQSDQARRVGQMPQDEVSGFAGAELSDTMAQPTKQAGSAHDKEQADLMQAIERAVPESEEEEQARPAGRNEQ